LTAIVLLALAVHGALLLMQLPASSYDANTHMFFAAHYAHHWFDPWNEKWFAGFSQTTYPPLVHQWIAIFSKVMGLSLAYMFVQLAVILLLPVGMYRYARLWVDERAAGYAAIGSIFLGSLAMIVYQSGQLPTTMAAMLLLNALPYFYRWSRSASGSALVKGLLLSWAAAAAHHVTFLFGTVLFALPVLWLAVQDRRAEGEHSSAAGVLSRAAAFAAIGGIGVAIVLLPYWVQLLQNPIKQLPIPHASRDNYILNTLSGLNFWVIPYGALILALPFIFIRGASDRRLRPLFFGWWVTFLFGLGGTTPFARIVLGRAYYVLTYERFTFWSTLMALPIAALLAERLIHRFQGKAVIGLTIAAVGSFAMGVAWITYNPIQAPRFNTKPVIEFLNRDDHGKFRYLTLGFGSQFSQVSTLAHADTVDGDYNSARLLPEMTAYGAGKLDNAKYYGTAGMESLRAMLKHANQYGLKYIFVRDRFYDPLLAFAGWRPVETYDAGVVTLWSKEDVPPAHPMEFGLIPPWWQGVMWGLLPMGVCLVAILAVLALPERQAAGEPIAFPAPEPIYLREAK
jgi:hypothetical protein